MFVVRSCLRALTRLGKASLALLLLICLSVTAVFTVASRSNYPGGKALLALHEYHANMRQRSSSLQAFGLSHLSFLVVRGLIYCAMAMLCILEGG